jgi:hypothetical protein
MFLAGPGLRAESLLICMKSEQTSARSACHDEPADGAGPAIGGHHDCATIAPVIVTSVKRASADASSPFLDRSLQGPVVASAVLADLQFHGPPQSARHARPFVPLRI